MINYANTERGPDATELLLFGNWFAKRGLPEHFIEFTRRFGTSFGTRKLSTL
jgi:hypothetical protein